MYNTEQRYENKALKVQGIEGVIVINTRYGPVGILYSSLD